MEDYLRIMIAALVVKAGGRVELTPGDMEMIPRSGYIDQYKDPDTGNLVLQFGWAEAPAGTLQ